MLNKLRKSKAGFTLIEMLVVIAIVAILVSVLIPMISTANIKASAATNAANLRSVEAAVTATYLQSPEKFGSGDMASGVAERISTRLNEISNTLLGSSNPYLIHYIESAIESIINAVEGSATYYANDETLTFEDVTVTAPKSKALVFEDITLRKDTEMTVTITDGSVIASYDGLTVDYFAAIAESGKGDASGHTYRDSNNDGICDICKGDHKVNGQWFSNIDDIVGDYIDKEIGNAHTCSDANGDHDHLCDTEGCYSRASGCNTAGTGCTCTECGAQGAHSYRYVLFQGYVCSQCGAKR